MPDKNLQLFILPYAGGSIASFRRLSNLLCESVDVITVEYPGRGERSKEKPVSGFWNMYEDALCYVLERRNERIPFCLMGYSMGSILAYEMLARNRIPGCLKHLFIAAEVSPRGRALELRQADHPTEEELIGRAKQLGGLDERMLMNPRFREIYLKPMLADYRNFFEYRFTEVSGRIMTDATFFYCEKDTAYHDVKEWEELIDGQYDYHELGDNHFFINQHVTEIAEIMNRHFKGIIIGGKV